MGKTDRSRREKRKEVRSSKKQNKYEAWLHYQESQKLKRKSVALKSVNVEESVSLSDGPKQKYLQLPTDSIQSQSLDHSNILKKDKVKPDSSENLGSAKSKIGKMKKSMKEKSKTKFEEYLLTDMQYGGISAEEDLKMERRLAKKLKVKEGKLRGMDDGLTYVLGYMDEEPELAGEIDFKSHKEKSFGKKSKRQESEYTSEGADAVDGTDGASEPQDVSDKVVPGKGKNKRKILKDDPEDDLPETPGEEAALEEVPAKTPMPESNEKWVPRRLRTQVGSESKEHSLIRGRVRGLLNKLSESNIESITREVAMIYQSVARNVGSQIISEEFMKRAGGPRGREQDAAVFGAFVAAMACLVGVDFSAKIMASLAKTFEDEYLKEDNLSLRNITLLLSYLCIFGVCSSDLIYDFLITLSHHLTEIDVSTILTILQCCGMKIRSDDPVAMKNFIVSVQNRVNELKASPEDSQKKIDGKRMEFMLETILDIKNNKKRTKEDSVPLTRIKKWLQKLRVEDILIRGVKWSKLLDPDKKGQWWLSGDMASATDDAAEVANTIDKEVLEARKMLELASAQSMNTDARRAIFCVIMSGEDYVDAFEKILRLDLPGKQDRDIIRVLVECCLQEKVFNKYYTVLASKLCDHDKNHKFTLQFCIWDHFKKLDKMQLQRSMHLAKFVAEMVTSFSLSLAVLKTIDFSDPKQLTAKRIMHFRMLFESLFEYPDSLIWNAFTRLAVVPEFESLRFGMEFFIKEYVIQSNKGLEGKFKIAKKALGNMEGFLM